VIVIKQFAFSLVKEYIQVNKDTLHEIGNGALQHYAPWPAEILKGRS